MRAEGRAKPGCSASVEFILLAEVTTEIVIVYLEFAICDSLVLSEITSCTYFNFSLKQFFFENYHKKGKRIHKMDRQMGTSK